MMARTLFNRRSRWLPLGVAGLFGSWSLVGDRPQTRAIAQSPVPSVPVAAAPLPASSALPFAPIGSPSRVDRYARPASPPPAASGIHRVAMQSGGFAMPTDPPPPGAAPPLNHSPSPQLEAAPLLSPPPGQAAPPVGLPPQGFPAQPSTDPAQPSPNQPRHLPNQPRSLPNQPASPTNLPAAPDQRALDYQPVSPPQLQNGGFATMGDCRLITPPSGYTAMSPYGGGCGSVAPVGYAPVSYVPPPAEIAAPAVMPPLTSDLAPSVVYPATPQTAAPVIVAPPAAAPAGSLVTFGQETYPVQVGQGLWGQPVAYVPGQKFRNWLRYLSF